MPPVDISLCFGFLADIKPARPAIRQVAPRLGVHIVLSSGSLRCPVFDVALNGSGVLVIVIFKSVGRHMRPAATSHDGMVMSILSHPFDAPQIGIAVLLFKDFP